MIICFVLFSSAGLFQACNDWLDIRSGEVLLQEEVFGDADGFRIAVNGVYRQVASQELYGRNLTWGLMSVAAQHYLGGYNMTTLLTRMSNYEWEHTDLLGITESMWAKSYNIIANCNNIIQETEKKDGDFFIHGQDEKDLILGEMYGMRALLHFEMLRLFVPAPSTGYKGAAIPYVSVFPTHQPERLDYDQAIKLIIEDMEKARTLLKPLDTDAFSAWIRDVEHRFIGGKHAAAWSEFVNFRGVRMNYWAATGLLARIYLWNGDMSKAYDAAKEVYDYHIDGIFTWTGSYSQTNIDYLHPKRWQELLLAFYDRNNYDNYEKEVALNGNNSWAPTFAMKNMNELFGTETNDYRYSGLYRNNVYVTYRRTTSLSAMAQSIAEWQGPLQIVIRFPEMYHIMIECLIHEQKYGEARTLAAALRQARGTGDTLIPHNNDDMDNDGVGDFTGWLINDIIREGLTEGQVFYMFKRLNRDVFNGANPYPMTPAKFTPPYPNNETSYATSN